jgi:formylglycine-generating enzyme required for sulfatase activity
MDQKHIVTKLKANSPYIGQTCPVRRISLQSGDEVVICQQQDIPMTLAGWEAVESDWNGKCHYCGDAMTLTKSALQTVASSKSPPPTFLNSPRLPNRRIVTTVAAMLIVALLLGGGIIAGLFISGALSQSASSVTIAPIERIPTPVPIDTTTPIQQTQMSATAEDLKKMDTEINVTATAQAIAIVTTQAGATAAAQLLATASAQTEATAIAQANVIARAQYQSTTTAQAEATAKAEAIVAAPQLPILSWITIPGGDFVMGSSESDIQAAIADCNKYEGDCRQDWFTSEGPQRTTSVGAFEITKYEITNAQYNLCVSNGPCSPPTRVSTDNSIPNNPSFFTDNYPIVTVTVDDAITFCRWIGGRLPSEAEWEKVARGTDRRRYPWGSNLDLSQANLYSTGPMSVGSYPTGASPYGAMDIAGNVAEFTSDNILRGGSWKSFPHHGRVTNRSIGPWLTRDFTNFDIGFRCVR